MVQAVNFGNSYPEYEYQQYSQNPSSEDVSIFTGGVTPSQPQYQQAEQKSDINIGAIIGGVVLTGLALFGGYKYAQKVAPDGVSLFGKMACKIDGRETKSAKEAAEKTAKAAVKSSSGAAKTHPVKDFFSGVGESISMSWENRARLPKTRVKLNKRRQALVDAIDQLDAGTALNNGKGWLKQAKKALTDTKDRADLDIFCAGSGRRSKDNSTLATSLKKVLKETYGYDYDTGKTVAIGKRGHWAVFSMAQNPLKKSERLEGSSWGTGVDIINFDDCISSTKVASLTDESILRKRLGLYEWIQGQIDSALLHSEQKAYYESQAKILKGLIKKDVKVVGEWKTTAHMDKTFDNWFGTKGWNRYFSTPA